MCTCVCVCVHVANNRFIQRCTHQPRTQKQLTLYPHEEWGETVEGELPSPNGDRRDKVKNKVCLLCLPVELMWFGGERGGGSHMLSMTVEQLSLKRELCWGWVSLSPLKNPCCTMNLSPQHRALHKATICPNAMCVFNSSRIHSEFVIFHLIPLAWLASCCFAFR